MADTGAMKATSGTAVSDRSQPIGTAWRTLRTESAHSLVDARLQFHHAAQLATALGISYLPKKADDSHTNLEWIDALSALASNPVSAHDAIRVGVSASPFGLIVLVNDGPRANLSLDGRTISEAADWVRQHLATFGLDATKYTLAKHYTIPAHAVDTGAPFDASNADAFEQLAAWYGDASIILEEFVARLPHAETVRCWPHHFDIATLIQYAEGKTVSLGMEPGDVYYDQPYYYASTYPRPRADLVRPPLAGNGRWHTHEWIGAVLPATAVGKEQQRGQIEAFIDSALTATMELLANS
jgi:hypothetical protein